MSEFALLTKLTTCRLSGVTLDGGGGRQTNAAWLVWGGSFSRMVFRSDQWGKPEFSGVLAARTSDRSIIARGLTKGISSISPVVVPLLYQMKGRSLARLK